MKQVQRMDNDPQKYHIIYIGQHTCRDALISPQIVGDSWDPNVVSFENQMLGIKQEECSKEDTPSDLTDNCAVWKEFMAVDEYGGGVFSCTEATSQNSDMDFAVKSLDFDKDFQFELYQIN